jgi:CheY-like chemotaxis protein
MNIWLVCDNAFYSEVLNKLIENCTKHRITEKINNGEELISDLMSTSNKTSPDLILLSLYMDKTSGWEVLETFKNNNINIPVIIVTSSECKQDLMNTTSYKMVKGYFHKGNYPAALFDLINNI